MKSPTDLRRFLATCCCFAVSATASADVTPPLGSTVLGAIPADAVVVLSGRPLRDLELVTSAPSTGPAAGPETTIDAVLALLSTSGVLSGQGQGYADIAGCLPLLARHEFAVALLDISGTAPPSTSPTASQPSFRLEQLQVALVLRTNGHNDAVLTTLNRIISRYTNNTVATLTTQPVGRYEVQRLRDRRAPAWAVCEWLAMDKLFIVTYGAGAMEQVVATLNGDSAALAADPWFRAAQVRCDAPRGWVSITLNHRQAQRRLPDVILTRLRAVIGSLGNAGDDRELWIVGLDGREWTLRRVCRRGSRDIFADYTPRRAGDESLRGRIPAEAKHFAILRVPLRRLIENSAAAILAAQRQSRADAMRKWWAATESDSGVDIDTEILPRLGDELVLFDYPPHPLRIPFALTVAVPIRDPDRARAAVDAAFTAWSKYLQSKKSSPLLAMSINRADDGLWYLQAGIVGPALKVTDRFIVLSWSPQALREALARFDP